MTETTTTTVPITMSMTAFFEASDLGRTSTYKLIEAGEIESVLSGRRRLIIVQSYVDYLARQREAQAGGIGRIASPNPRAGVHQATHPSPASKAARGGRAIPAKRPKVRRRRA